MPLSHQIIVIVLMYLVSIWLLRGFIDGVKRYLLNNSAYKKSKKTETFKDWLFYDKYREMFPKALLVFYFVVLFIHPLCIAICVVMNLMGISPLLGRAVAIFIFGFDILWAMVLSLMFWSSKPRCPYERWIEKKRGQKKNKK